MHARSACLIVSENIVAMTIVLKRYPAPGLPRLGAATITAANQCLVAVASVDNAAITIEANASRPSPALLGNSPAETVIRVGRANNRSFR